MVTTAKSLATMSRSRSAERKTSVASDLRAVHGDDEMEGVHDQAHDHEGSWTMACTWKMAEPMPATHLFPGAIQGRFRGDPGDNDNNAIETHTHTHTHTPQPRVVKLKCARWESRKIGRSCVRPTERETGERDARTNELADEAMVVDGGWWMVDGGWWMVGGGWWMVERWPSTV